MSVESLIREIQARHTPNPPADGAELDAFESREGYPLPEDLRSFYSHSNGARLFDPTEPRYDILPVARIIKARVAIYGDDNVKYGPGSLYAICDVCDGNYLGIELDLASKDAHKIFDCYHETFPDEAYTRAVANSFTEFVELALKSEGKLYFLGF